MSACCSVGTTDSGVRADSRGRIMHCDTVNQSHDASKFGEIISTCFACDRPPNKCLLLSLY